MYIYIICVRSYIFILARFLAEHDLRFHLRGLCAMRWVHFEYLPNYMIHKNMRLYIFFRCKILFECRGISIDISRFIGFGKHGRFVSQQVAPINAHCHWDVPLSKGDETNFDQELDRIGVLLETLKFIGALCSENINFMFWVVTFFLDTTLETDPGEECLVI